ncbi:beta-lactamase family protein [Pseudoflavitalea sp. G-6-1-2]|uniref:serine hydrolase domain-containing protein n=1 Tax=Pseudoflavitalea sp. G-6-1-2 TaxID=2728841 RepID=UPI00146C32BD|nr:serine hydrolase domain-containing protein [Pseudoflavitalea sp. G-6-1-2]NML23210.1 beta-lactamase family protein [Pseudoflavitalea sp. G-6-1-2]
MKKIIVFLGGLCLFMAAGAQLKTLSGRHISPQQLEQVLRHQMDSLHIPGISFALINNGKVVFHRAMGITNVDTKQKVNPQSIFEAASLSKPVFAVWVLKMVDDGLLSLDTPLYKYFPYPDIEHDDRYKLITARMVLAHTSGFPNWRWFQPADSSLDIPPAQLYLKFTPGTQFNYSGEGYLYLSRVIAHLNHVSIQQLDQLFQQQLATPLHMRYAWFSWNAKIRGHKVTGHNAGKANYRTWHVFPGQDSTWFGAAGGLNTEALSYSQFIIHLINLKDTRMFNVQVQLPTDDNGEKSDTAWGLGIAIRPMPFGTIYEHTGDNGDFKAGMAINRKNKTGYVVFTNCDNGNIFNKQLRAYLSMGSGASIIHSRKKRSK